MQSSTPMTQTEWKYTLILSLLFVFRMLALFMVLPVLALSAEHYTGATPALLGLTLGIYGLTQALLQMPFGLLSDRFGRKPVVLVGLALFAAGSLLAALSTSVTGLILGRALQGAGAIGSSVLAWLSDLTRPAVRTKAMALIGISIGASFLLALIIGPVIDAWFGFSGLFWSALVFAGLSFILVAGMSEGKKAIQITSFRDSLKALLKQRALWILCLSVLCLHASLTACFLFLPGIVAETTQLTKAHWWQFYTPILLLSGLGMMLFVRLSERYVSRVLLLGVTLFALSEALLSYLHFSWIGLSLILVLFFTAFNFLEALIPSLVSKIVDVTHKGAALGWYASFQFMGIFLGGGLGGLCLQWFGARGVVMACVILAGIWFILVRTLDLNRVS